MSHKKLSKHLISIIFFILLISCTNEMNNYNSNKNNILNKIKTLDTYYYEKEQLIFVDIETQQLFLLNKGKLSKNYLISSSYYGTGSKENSLRTPLGRHEIYKKLGENLPINAILKGRVWNGAVAEIIREPIDTEFDHVTSRILWLDGLEIGKNKGKGIDSRERYIYIHGTAEEGLIGKPASDGCIRMYNRDVIELFDLVDEKAQVWIY